MSKDKSIIDIVRNLGIQQDQLRDFFNMDYLEDEIHKAKEHIDEGLEKLKTRIHQRRQKHHDAMKQFKKLILNRKHKIKKINLKDIDVISLFKELIQKKKITVEEADLYFNEWFQYARQQCHSKKLTKKYILIVMSLLFIESSLPQYSSAEMLEVSDNHMNSTTGKSGISVTMTSPDGNKERKDIHLDQLDKHANAFIDQIKEKMNAQGLPEMEINMDDLARDFESIEINSPIGGLKMRNFSISGSGTAKVTVR
ncbi:hypothetical protein MHK_002951 [Candidatus Magnetomorum sp. HK-1]|nr:hypothetical protein MHK_002951 [Candidatus Magnetomorum sp. HK-1]